MSHASDLDPSPSTHALALAAKSPCDAHDEIDDSNDATCLDSTIVSIPKSYLVEEDVTNSNDTTCSDATQCLSRRLA